MKSILGFIVVSGAFALNSFHANAQKIAHLNLDSLISIMPETKVATAAVQEFSKQLEGKVAGMQEDLQMKYEKYQVEMKDLPELVRASREMQLNVQNKSIQDYQQQAQQEYQKKSEELSKPVYEKARKAIRQVAQENGFRYAIDTSTGVVIYNEPDDDIFDLVAKKLGIAVSAPVNSPKK